MVVVVLRRDAMSEFTCVSVYAVTYPCYRHSRHSTSLDRSVRRFLEEG